MVTAGLTDTDARVKDAVIKQLEWDPKVDNVAPQQAGRDIHRRIAQALHHNADVDVRHVRVDVSGDTATLTGTVGTWLQRDSVERAAANAPGIRKVVNLILVEPPAWSASDADEIC